MAVTEPLKVRIENFAELELPSTLVVPDFPQEASSKTHPVAVDGTIYIESSDFREVLIMTKYMCLKLRFRKPRRASAD